MSSIALFLVSFIAFFVLGMPIAAAMIISSFMYALNSGMGLAIMGTKMFTGLNNFALVAIPLFILTAEVMNRTSVADRIFKFCRDMVGYIPGGMGHVNITTSIIFAGMSGSAVADAGGIGHLAYQAMVDEGFDREFSASTTVASSTIGPIIPPSIPAVVYAMVANVSVGRLLFGGILDVYKRQLQGIGHEEGKDICFTVAESDLLRAAGLLEDHRDEIRYARLETNTEIAKVSVVGAGMINNPGVAATLFEALYDANININMISTSEIKISVLVDKKDADKAVQVIHDKFFSIG